MQEVIRRRVIEQWISGFPRDKIASDLQIGAGTVSGIVVDFKKNLQASDIDSARELAIDAKRQGLSLYDLASHFRLYNYFIKSGVEEDKVESFITNVSSTDISHEKLIEFVSQLFNISKAESIPLDQVSEYIKEKLQEKQKIEEEIKQADALLQSKNVNIEAINEHIQLNEKLNEYNLSFQDIDKLLNVLINVKENGFDGKKIVGKIRSIKRLEKKEERLRNNCEILSKQLTKYKEIIPLAELIHSMHISGRELVSFKAALNEAAETYGLTPTSAALDVINLIKDHNKKGQLKRELYELSFEKYAIDRFCSSHSQVIMALMNLKSHGISEERILQLNSFLENNGYNIDLKSTFELDSYINAK
jgi:hypothetical protein